MDYEEPVWYFVSIERSDPNNECIPIQVMLPEESALRLIKAAMEGDDRHTLHIWMNRCRPEEAVR